MDEILYELREHSYGLNAGRWDYIFSMIKCFRDRPEFVLPDRNDVKMTVPFMRAYTELLVQTCHARGAFAMGGMAALIPSRKDEEANERAIDAAAGRQGARGRGRLRRHLGRASRRRSTSRMDAFDAVLGDKPNQIDKQRADVDVTRRGAARRRRPRRARSPRRACAATSTSASSTSRSGSAAAAPRGSTT